MKRKIALILAAIMVATAALSGCTSNGDKKNESSASTDSKATSTESSTGDDRAMEGNLYLTGRPLVKEQESFTMFCDDSGLAEDKILYPILEEQTNVKVELQLFPYDAAVEKKNVLLNSGDYPDVMGGWILTEPDILTQGMEEQVYIPLDDLFTKYGPKMLEVLELPGVRSGLTLPDGKIYTIPYVVAEPEVTFSPWINQEWLDAVKLPMPTTTEELRTVLKAFKEKDPNGNGKADEIGFSCSPNNRYLDTLAGWFGVNASGSGTNKYFSLVDGKLEFGANKDGYKEFVKYFASLNKDGLLDPELFTQDETQWAAKEKTETYGVSFAYGPTSDKDPATARTVYRPLPVLKSDYTDKPVYRRNSYGSTLFRTQLVITDKAKNPATIMRWWDNMFLEENSMLTNAGPLGEWGIEKLEDGSYRSLDTESRSDEDKAKYGWGNLWTQSLPKFAPLDKVVAPPVGVVSYDENKARDELYRPYLDEAVPGVWVDSDAAARQGTLETDINTYVQQKQAEWISGKKDVEAEWAAYLAQLDKLGLPELTKMRAEAVAKALANEK